MNFSAVWVALACLGLLAILVVRQMRVLKRRQCVAVSGKLIPHKGLKHLPPASQAQK